MAQVKRSRYFSAFGNTAPEKREHQNAKHPVNQMLNYGYAVLGAIIHRSIAIHGLNPALGVHHRFRFRSDPLVYDLLEPLRPLCDYLLLRFHLADSSRNIKVWVKQVAQDLLDFKVVVDQSKSLKLIYAIDRYVLSVADAFRTGAMTGLFIPCLKAIKLKEFDG